MLVILYCVQDDSCAGLSLESRLRINPDPMISHHRLVPLPVDAHDDFICRLKWHVAIHTAAINAMIRIAKLPATAALVAVHAGCRHFFRPSLSGMRIMTGNTAERVT